MENNQKLVHDWTESDRQVETKFRQFEALHVEMNDP